MKSLSRVQLFATPWTVAHQAPPSMGFSRQEYWSGLPFPSPGDLPNPGIEPRSPALQADTLNSEPPGKSLELKRVEGKGFHPPLQPFWLSILWHLTLTVSHWETWLKVYLLIWLCFIILFFYLEKYVYVNVASLAVFCLPLFSF